MWKFKLHLSIYLIQRCEIKTSLFWPGIPNDLFDYCISALSNYGMTDKPAPFASRFSWRGHVIITESFMINSNRWKAFKVTYQHARLVKLASFARSKFEAVISCILLIFFFLFFTLLKVIRKQFPFCYRVSSWLYNTCLNCLSSVLFYILRA